MADVPNETLAYMLSSQKETGDKRHAENRERLEQIYTEVKTTNGRLQKVEQRQAADLQRFAQIDSEFERIDTALRRRAIGGRGSRRELVIRGGWAAMGTALI